MCLTSSSGRCLPAWKIQHWVTDTASTTESNFQQICTLDLYRPYIRAPLSFLLAWHISLCFCSDAPYLQSPLYVLVSHVKSLIASDSDDVFQFLLQSVSAPPRTMHISSFTYVFQTLNNDFFSRCLKSNIELAALRVTQSISLCGKIPFQGRSYWNSTYPKRF